MKRYRVEEQKKKGRWVASADPLLKPFPTINQMCTDTQWEDGSERTPCNLKFRFGQDAVNMTLVDDENESYITTTAENTFEALKLLEAALEGGKVHWKSFGNFDKKKKK